MTEKPKPMQMSVFTHTQISGAITDAINFMEMVFKNYAPAEKIVRKLKISSLLLQKGAEIQADAEERLLNSEGISCEPFVSAVTPEEQAERNAEFRRNNPPSEKRTDRAEHGTHFGKA